jgi:type II secretory ATPase GspE/PulE/Tfp pilus assembly ATPase PilB-like protein
MEDDPINRFVLLVLFQAQQDRATELIFAPASVDSAPIRYKVDGTWYDLSPPPASILPDVMNELGRLAKLTNGAKEGEICATFSNARLRWRITVSGAEAGFLLTPITAHT